MADKPTVFVVDDNPSVLISMERLLRSIGLNVKTFSSAKDFLDYIPKEKKWCLILDVRMPGIDGLELQEILCKNGYKNPIIFITAHEDPIVKRKGMNAGAIAFLYKPLNEQELMDALNMAIGFKSAEPIC